MAELNPQAALDILLRSDFRTFAMKAFETVFPGTQFEHAPYIDGLIFQAEQILSGESMRLIVCLCPRSLKSFFLSVCLPAFALGQDPTRQILVVSHSEQLAVPLAGQFRKIIATKWYRSAFSKMRADPTKNTERQFVTTEGGYRMAISAEGSVTGLGADLMILDDMIDAGDALNAEACRKRGEWITRALFSRMNNPTKTPVILVMQRLSIWDPVAHLLPIGNWRNFTLPVKADRDYEFSIGENETTVLRAGEFLTPRIGPEQLEEIQRSRSNADFQAQYMQQPVPIGGMGVDMSAFKRYSKLPDPIDFTFLSVDPATGSPTGDYTVIQRWAVSERRLFLANQVRRRLNFSELKDAMIRAIKKYKPLSVLIENSSVGPALCQELYQTFPIDQAARMLGLRNPKQSKEVRLATAMILMEQGRVYLPVQSNWLDGFTAELQAFPNAAHDDQVDAMTQALNWYRQWEKGPPEVTVTMIGGARRRTSLGSLSL